MTVVRFTALRAIDIRKRVLHDDEDLPLAGEACRVQDARGRRYPAALHEQPELLEKLRQLGQHAMESLIALQLLPVVCTNPQERVLDVCGVVVPAIHVPNNGRHDLPGVIPALDDGVMEIIGRIILQTVDSKFMSGSIGIDVDLGGIESIACSRRGHVCIFVDIVHHALED